MLTLLLFVDPAAASAWLPFVEKIGLPVFIAGTMLVWFALRLEKKLDAQTAADLKNAEEVAGFRAELKEFRKELEDVAEDVEDIQRDVTGKHIVPPELRAASGGKKEG